MSVDFTNANPAMDYQEHERTYEGFLFMIKLLIISVIVLLIGMAYFLL